MIWLVGIGGSFGAGARYLLGNWLRKKSTSMFPFSTFTINLLGSFLLGLLVNLHRKALIDDTIYFTFGIGFFGAFTTFSTFALEVVFLLVDKRYKIALVYIVCSVLLTILGATLGILL